MSVLALVTSAVLVSRLAQDVSAPLAGDWRVLPAGPKVLGRPGAVVATNTGFLVVPEMPMPDAADAVADVALYDLATGRWERIETPRYATAATAVWTGSLLYAMSTTDEGLAFWSFSPQHRRWAMLPEPPLPRDTAGSMVWTGNELLVWGGRDHQPRAPVGFAAYAPSTGRWRLLDAGPLSPRQFHSATWTGKEMLVVGGTDLVGPDMADAAAYNPAQDRWRSVAPLAHGRYQHRAFWTGSSLVVLGGSHPDSGATIEVYSPGRDEWDGVRGLPWPVSADSAIVPYADSLLVVGGGQTPPGQMGFLVDPARSVSRRVAGPLGTRCGARGAASSHFVLVVGGEKCSVEPSPEDQTAPPLQAPLPRGLLLRIADP